MAVEKLSQLWADSDFIALLAEVKGRIQEARTRAVLAANSAYPEPAAIVPEAVAPLPDCGRLKKMDTNV